jgi:hypothetical protein
LCTLVLSVALAGCSRKVKQEDPDDGDAAPEIKGKDLNGNKMTLSHYRGKVVLLVFWSST